MSQVRGSDWQSVWQFRSADWTLKYAYPMYLAEFIGTMVYAMTFAIVTEPNYIGIQTPNNTYSINESYFIAPIAVGFMLIAIIYAFGHISGAHFNPAITISVWIRGGLIEPIDAMIFIIVQLIGSFCGAMIAWIVTDKVPYLMPGGDDSNSNNISQGRSLVAEIIYTFAICLVVINVTTTESQRGNFFYGVSIGMTVAAGLASVQRISGGCFNPALGTALSITQLFRDNGGTMKYIWIYLVGPAIGAILSGFSFYIINTKEVEQSNQIQEQY